ncbi:MAG: HEAT repeat domain-containing protein [Capsulimonas sp.]|uniref:HEAT repeat domain-containing protein n=1 Tax=Capsulimonas sp. TaxID=2494211 RepID=UPI0032664FD5
MFSHILLATDGSKHARANTPYSLPSLPEGADRAWLLGAMASDGNGFVRHAAVQGLSEIDSGDELPFLLWRTTDWVEPVRELAIAAVHERLRDSRYCLTFANVRRSFGDWRMGAAAICRI